MHELYGNHRLALLHLLAHQLELVVLGIGANGRECRHRHDQCRGAEGARACASFHWMSPVVMNARWLLCSQRRVTAKARPSLAPEARIQTLGGRRSGGIGAPLMIWDGASATK